MNLHFMKKTVQRLLTLVVANILVFVPVYALPEITAAVNEAGAKTPQKLLNGLKHIELALYKLSIVAPVTPCARMKHFIIMEVLVSLSALCLNLHFLRPLQATPSLTSIMDIEAHLLIN